MTERLPTRFALKLFAASGDDISSDDFVAVFHRWIQEKKLADTMIDVIDYAHVHHGPGVVLVTHAAHYSTDRADGRFGLAYAQKRDATGTLEERLLTAGRALLATAAALEAEPTLAGRLRYRRDELAITLHDRLEAPNDAATAAELHPALERAAALLLDTRVALTPAAPSPGAPLTFTAKRA